MSEDLAFVGDIHGNLDALQGLISAMDTRNISHAVFLGDYINRGPDSSEVIQQLLLYQTRRKVTMLAGNHELALLNAIESGDLTTFLRIGGATTVRSYLRRNSEPDALDDLRKSIPGEHLDAIKNMPLVFENDDLIAQHSPPFPKTSKFEISAHTPSGIRPRLGQRYASIDTGCGTSSSGRLTAFLWPSFDFVQVTSAGVPVCD